MRHYVHYFVREATMNMDYATLKNTQTNILHNKNITSIITELVKRIFSNKSLFFNACTVDVLCHHNKNHELKLT